MSTEQENNPTLPLPTRDLTDAQILAGFQNLSQALREQGDIQLRVGLFTEYLYECIARAVDVNGDPLVPIDMEEFDGWAQNRLEEIQKEAERRAAPPAPEAKPQVDLSEESD